MDMEKLKNNIGNIVLLDPTRNNKNDNKPFIDKKNSFENTGIGIHSWIYEQKEWTEESVKKLTETYVDAAVKVFLSLSGKCIYKIWHRSWCHIILYIL